MPRGESAARRMAAEQDLKNKEVEKAVGTSPEYLEDLDAISGTATKQESKPTKKIIVLEKPKEDEEIEVTDDMIMEEQDLPKTKPQGLEDILKADQSKVTPGADKNLVSKLDKMGSNLKKTEVKQTAEYKQVQKEIRKAEINQKYGPTKEVPAADPSLVKSLDKMEKNVKMIDERPKNEVLFNTEKTRQAVEGNKKEFVPTSSPFKGEGGSKDKTPDEIIDISQAESPDSIITTEWETLRGDIDNLLKPVLDILAKKPYKFKFKRDAFGNYQLKTGIFGGAGRKWGKMIQTGDKNVDKAQALITQLELTNSAVHGERTTSRLDFSQAKKNLDNVAKNAGKGTLS